MIERSQPCKQLQQLVSMSRSRSFKSTALTPKAAVIRRQLRRAMCRLFFRNCRHAWLALKSVRPSWSRELQIIGHTVRLIPPANVKPVREAVEKRRHGRRGDLRCSPPGQHAVCRDQDGGAAEPAWYYIVRPSVHPPADLSARSSPCSSCQVRLWRAGRTQWRGSTAFQAHFLTSLAQKSQVMAT
jgi:hypothetical protein